MLFIISPAKKIDNIQDGEKFFSKKTSNPYFIQESQYLSAELAKLSPEQLASLMGISDKLAWLNVTRYQQIVNDIAKVESDPAIYLFAGDVYKGIDVASLNPTALNYLQQHLFILSGLYGLLNAFDLISPYRLEMGTRFKTTQADNLYEFWRPKIAKRIEQIIKQHNWQYLINLASQEYFKAVAVNQLSVPIITPLFKKFDQKTQQYKVVGILAKRARGLMVRYAAVNQLSSPEALQQFDYEGYRFNAALSNETEWVFIQ